MSQQEVLSIVIRAVKTFLQAFFATLAAGVLTTVDGAAVKALVIASFAAGISAVMNVFIKPVEAK